jgi:beta-glucosidase
MCYLPGTEGGGIAPVILGESNFNGKLPMPWYGSLENIGENNADIEFPLGYGLTY